MHHSALRGNVWLVLVCFTLAGCGSKYGAQTTAVVNYPQCYAPINELRQAESSMESSVATGAILGSLLGAVVGYAATGKASGAAVGAVAGAGVGSVAGHATAKSQERDMLARHLSQLQGDISGVDNVTAAGRLAIQCYDKEFKSALASFKAGRLTRDQLRSRYAEITSGTQEALSLMGSTIQDARAREGQYQAALNEAAAKEGRTPPPVVRPASKSKPRQQAKPQDDLTRVAAQTGTLIQSRENLETEVARGNAMQDAWAADLASIMS